MQCRQVQVCWPGWSHPLSLLPVPRGSGNRKFTPLTQWACFNDKRGGLALQVELQRSRFRAWANPLIFVGDNVGLKKAMGGLPLISAGCCCLQLCLAFVKLRSNVPSVIFYLFIHGSQSFVLRFLVEQDLWKKLKFKIQSSFYVSLKCMLTENLSWHAV